MTVKLKPSGFELVLNDAHLELADLDIAIGKPMESSYSFSIPDDDLPKWQNMFATRRADLTVRPEQAAMILPGSVLTFGEHRFKAYYRRKHLNGIRIFFREQS